MGSSINFKNFTSEDGGSINGNRQFGNMGLTRQTSIYSLTFDELQNTMGISTGKDFGSMNMDELLKNIWSAEETQNYGAAGAAAVLASSGVASTAQEGNNLQRQGSLTLPRTLSQKTVDEVWRDISKEYGIVKDTSAGSSMPQRQQTLGEVTLEEFLVRAGVVREDNNGGFFGDLSRGGNNNNNNNIGLGFGYQQMGRGGNLMANRVLESSSNQSSNQASALPLNVNGVRLNMQQAQQQQQQQQQIYPKQPTMAYVNQLPLQGSPAIRGGIVGISDQGISNNLVQGAALQGGGMGMVGFGAGAVGVATGSPASQLSPNGIAKSNGDTSSVSPIPYVFNGGVRGRKMGGAVEKVVERRQRRMIKNRESAARSRARKQAYTMELEQEVAKLKEENQELRKKQAEIMEMQKNQALEMMNMQQGSKRQCLRRTQTGPW